MTQPGGDIEELITTTIDDLQGECLSQIFRHLNPKDLGRCCCVSPQWRTSIKQDEDLWKRLASDIYCLTDMIDPRHQPVSSYYLAFLAWEVSLGMYGDLATRALRAWKAIETWTETHFPEIRDSLRPGATEEQLDAVENGLRRKFPPSLRVLYRIHDGQALDADRDINLNNIVMGPSVFHGLFGGYSFYSHIVSTRMLPLNRLQKWTSRISQVFYHNTDNLRLVFAASFYFNKIFYCEPDGSVTVTSVDKVSTMQAIPPTSADADTDTDAIGDGILKWFEAYAASLSEGQFAVEQIVEEIPFSRGICLFPQASEVCSEAVTEGIRVNARPIFVPEHTRLSAQQPTAVNLHNDDGNEDGSSSYFFAYSIRFSLLPIEAQRAAVEEESLSGSSGSRVVHSAQLQSRHWIIRGANGAVESEVRGDGVIGLYPLLTQGGPEVVYQSCTHQKDRHGTMEGEFAFLEGSLARPGREIIARCAPFKLQLPEYIF